VFDRDTGTNATIPFKLIADHDPNSLVNSLKNINISNEFHLLPEASSNSIYQPLPFEIEKNITLNDISLNSSQQYLMTSLLQKYQHIFQDKPGIHTFFSYKFNVKPHDSYKIKPYPVPFSHRPAVQTEIDK